MGLADMYKRKPPGGRMSQGGGQEAPKAARKRPAKVQLCPHCGRKMTGGHCSHCHYDNEQDEY